MVPVPNQELGLAPLFVQAEQNLEDVDCTRRGMVHFKKRRRNVLPGRLALAALLVVFERLLSAPLQNTAGVITQASSATLLELEKRWITLILAALNSIAA